jgi:thioredoxin reductase (NADPH)
MILCLGFIANIGSIKDWGLVIEDGGVLVEAGTMSTSLPGVYAAGDMARYPGKMNLIASGFGEAAAAANQAKHFIDPDSKVFPGHSSEK